MDPPMAAVQGVSAQFVPAGARHSGRGTSRLQSQAIPSPQQPLHSNRHHAKAPPLRSRACCHSRWAFRQEGVLCLRSVVLAQRVVRGAGPAHPPQAASGGSSLPHDLAWGQLWPPHSEMWFDRPCPAFEQPAYMPSNIRDQAGR